MPLNAPKSLWRSKCCVEGCSTRICSGVSMHGFPRMDRYPDLYQHWVDAIRLANKTPFWNPRKSTKVCAFHFETVENCRIRVPTVFPNIDGQIPSTSEDRCYEDVEEDDEDFTEVDNEEDPMDTYEDSIAAYNIVQEDDSSRPYSDTENTSTVAYEAIIDEDSAMAYNEIEEKYNTIVGDVMSTLTYDNVMDDDTNGAYNEVGEVSAISYNEEVEEEKEEEEEQAAEKEEAEKEEEEERQAAEKEEAEKEEEEVTTQCNIEEEIVYDDVYVDGENATIETQILPERIGLNQDDLGDSEYCVVVVRRESDEIKPESPKTLEPSKSNSTIKKNTTNKGNSKKSGKKRPRKKITGKMVKIKAAKPLPSSSESSSATARSTVPDAVPEGSILPSKEVQENLKSQEMTSEPATIRLQEQEASIEEPQVEKPPSEAVGTHFEERVTSPTKTMYVEQEEQKILPCNGQEKDTPSESMSIKRTELNGVKIDDLVLDGQPIKLKKCTVNIAKTPTNPKRKMKAPSARKDEKAETKQKTTPSGSLDQHSGKDKKIMPESSSDFLNALSLRSSQEEEDANSGLRRSARIRAGAGKRRKFGTRSSWSVAFKNPPKKKLKVEIDENSQSSESSVPYDFEDENDPEIGVSDLEGDYTSGSEGESTSVSEADFGISSSGAKTTKPKPLPKLNGLTTRKQSKGRIPYSASAEGTNRPKFHGYQRVRLGDQATQVGLPGSCDGFIFDVVRDDPRNVGISCNIFYHYQPKNYRPTWARLKRNLDSPSNAATKNGLKHRLSAESTHNIGSTNKHAQKAAESKDTTNERKSKYDKPIQETPSVSMQNLECGERVVDVGKSLEIDSSKNHRFEGIETTNEREYAKADETVGLTKSAYPEDIYIKVEPAMNVPPGIDNIESDLVENAVVDGKSQKTDDINSFAVGALAELEVKEEEEFHDCEQEEMVRIDQQSCIVTDLCEVSHDYASTDPVNKTKPLIDDVDDAGGTVNSFRSIPMPEPGEVAADSSEPVTEIMEIDDTPRHEDPAERSGSVKAFEHGAENRVGDIKTDSQNVEEPMDTSGASLHDQGDLEYSSESTATPSRSELPNKDVTLKMSTKHVAAPSMPTVDIRLDSLNEAEALLEGRKPDVMNDSELTEESADLPGIHSQEIDNVEVERDMPTSMENSGKLSDIQNDSVVDSAVPAEFISGADTEANSAKSAGSLDDVTNSAECVEFSAERSSFRDPENVGESTASNALVDPERAAEISEESPDVAVSVSSTEAEKSKYTENVQHCSNSDGIQAKPGHPDKCSNAMADSEKSSEPAVHAGMSGNGTDTENVKESMDSECFPALPEAKCQDDADKSCSGEGQDEAIECPNHPDLSSDFSTDSDLIEVPIPEIASDSDVGGPVVILEECRAENTDGESPISCVVPEMPEETMELHQAPDIGIDENPSADANSARESEKSLQNSEESLGGAGKAREVPVSNTPNRLTVRNYIRPFEEKVSHAQSENTAEVFDSIERNLEKMFDMDR